MRGRKAGRGDRIRTCDPQTPSLMRYQAALRPDQGPAHLERQARAWQARHCSVSRERDRRAAFLRPTMRVSRGASAFSGPFHMFASPAYAQAAGAAPQGGISSLLPLAVPWVLIFVIFYLLVIRPQQQGAEGAARAIDAAQEGRYGRHRRRPDRQGDQGRRRRGRGRDRPQRPRPRAQGDADRCPPAQRAGQAGERLMLDFPRWKVDLDLAAARWPASRSRSRA